MITSFPIADKNWNIEVARGNIPGFSFVHKFGRYASLSTTLAPVCSSGVYQTPTAAVSLEFVSSSASDALNSTGMFELTVVGLDSSWNEQTVATAAHATDGTVAVAITGTWLRVYRAYVSKSGAYANASTPSHIGSITIRVAGAGATYAAIPTIDTNFGAGQTFIGAYTVPAGYTAYVLNEAFSSDISGSKTTNFYFFQRLNADDVSSPYTGTMRVQKIDVGTQSWHAFKHETPESYPAKTDIGFMAKATSATDASVSFEILLVQDGY